MRKHAFEIEPQREKAGLRGFQLGMIQTDMCRERSLKFRIQEEEKLYYQFRENKAIDQLYNYSTADLHLCFRNIKSGFLVMRLSKFYISTNTLLKL